MLNIELDKQEMFQHTLPPPPRLTQMAATCILIRAFEEKLLELFAAGHINGTTHTSIGQEVNAVGVLTNCTPDDIVVSSHRCHAHYIARMREIRRLMAEILGLPEGVCAGIGGSQHLCVPGAFYSNGIQGGIAPFALGLAIAKQRRKESGIVVTFLGDGTLGEGVLYETLNIARLTGAPVLFVVEDNGVAQSTDTATTTAGQIADRFRAFDIRTMTLDYPSLEEVDSIGSEIMAQIRESSGPAALVIRCMRLGPHSKGDDTRPAELLEALWRRDPFLSLRRAIGDTVYTRLQAEAREHVENEATALLARRAEKECSALPIASPPPSTSEPTIVNAVPGLRQNEQLRGGISLLLKKNKAAVLMGEDILFPYGGAFKVAGDLSQRFPDQVMSTPISEAAICGIAGGISVGGGLPIAEIMFGDFATLGFDQIVNHFAKYRQMYAGQVRTPGIIRVPMGGRRGYGPTHSQSLEKHFLGVPGLNVVAPSILHPVEEMLIACAESDFPTLFVENKLDYARIANMEDGLYCGFRIRRRGTSQAPTLALSLTEFDDDQFSLLVYGGMLHIAIEAVERLAVEHEVIGRIICISSLSPVPVTDISGELVGRYAVIAEEGGRDFGWGSEVAASLIEVNPDIRIARVGAKQHCIPAALHLENKVLPGVEDIVAAGLQWSLAK